MPESNTSGVSGAAIIRLLTALDPAKAMPPPVAAVTPNTLLSGRHMTITGASCKLPGGANSVLSFADTLSAAVDMASVVPGSRWDADTPSLDPMLAARARYGNFTTSAHLFDNSHFSISHQEAIAMDPQQRLVLEFGYSALHAAGSVRSSLASACVGVAVGIYATEFQQVVARSPLVNSVYASTNALSIACGRVSFVLGLHGPCASFETACSASLTACHSARRALQLDECEAHLVTGVNLMLTRDGSDAMAIASMTSPNGRCHTFDSRADGFARGEGVSSIHCLPHATPGIRSTTGNEQAISSVSSTAVRQDGRSASLTAPSGQAQQHLLQAAHADGGFARDVITLHEAHGTGTSLGDPIEVGSTGAVLASGRSGYGPTSSSAKGSVGHGESTAGLTGLLKLAIGLEKMCSQPNPQLRVLNPHVKSAMRQGELELPVQTVMLRSRVTEKLHACTGGVSSFGYAGTIAHAVLHSEGVALASACPQMTSLRSKRRSLIWFDPPHPFISTRVHSADGTSVFRSPIAGAVFALVADHVVQSRIIFPGAGYLEAARAAWGADKQSAFTAAHLQSIFFLRPLVLNKSRQYLECFTDHGGAVIRSGVDSSDESIEHSSAEYARSPQRICPSFDLPSKSSRCTQSFAAEVLYQAFFDMGLEYGPTFRALERLWTSDKPEVFAQLRRASPRRLLIRPADLDAALQSFEVTQVSGASPSGQVARLPFAIDEACLVAKAANQMWAFTEAKARDAVGVFLGTVDGAGTAWLEGYRARALQTQDIHADGTLERHLVPWTTASHSMLSSQQLVQQTHFFRGSITPAMYDLVDGHSALPHCALFPLSAHLEMASFVVSASRQQGGYLTGAAVLRPLIINRPLNAEWKVWPASNRPFKTYPTQSPPRSKHHAPMHSLFHCRMPSSLISCIPVVAAWSVQSREKL